MSCNIKAGEQIRVFISSAQNTEDGFSWSDFRRKIKESLDDCPFINPFIIEESPSEFSSTNLFVNKVIESDIIILLVKNELRHGTETEFITAQKYKKPMLVYFFGDEKENEDVIKLRKKIKEDDSCTYCKDENTEGFENRIKKYIIQNVITYYHLKHFEMINQNSSEIIENYNNINVNISLTNESLSLFDSCYGYAFNIFNIQKFKTNKENQISLLHKIGVNSLEWLFNGIKLKYTSDIEKLLSNTKSIYGSNDWLKYRWKSIVCQMNNKLDEALNYEYKALDSAKKENQPQWLIYDILKDCRSIEIKTDLWENDTFAYNELNSMDIVPCFPVTDYYLKQIYNEINEEKFKINTANRFTQFLGSSFEKTFYNALSFFFSSLLYGSYHNMCEAREIFSTIFYEYAYINSFPKYILESLKLNILNGNSKKFLNIIKHDWDSIYSYLTENSGELLSLCDKVSLLFKNKMKLCVFAVLGLYLSDDIFEKTISAIYGIVDNITIDEAKELINGIYNNISRLEHNIVVDILSRLIINGKFDLGSRISIILFKIEFETVTEENQIKLCNALKVMLPRIMEKNGNPQIIAKLEKANPNIFSILSTIPHNGLTGIDKLLYDVNMGKGNWEGVLKHEISVVKKYFEKNKNDGVYYGFAYDYYSLIIKSVTEHFTQEINEICNKELFPLFIDIINNCTTLPIVNSCLNTLNEILLFYKKEDLPYPNSSDLNYAIDNLDVSKFNSFVFLQTNTRKTLSCELLLSKIIIGSVDKSEFINWSFSYQKMNVNERITLSNCMETYLYYCKNIENEVDPTILSIVLQCFEDEEAEIRRTACVCLAYLLNTPYREIVLNRLYKATLDTSHIVRYKVLLLCTVENVIKDRIVIDEIINTLKGDSHYKIRKESQNYK